MSEKEQNNKTTQNDFMIEKIKQRPINRKKLIRRTILTATMAVIFGLVASLTFLFLEPAISKMLYPEEKPKIVVFPEDQQEMSPEEMLAESTPTPAPEKENGDDTSQEEEQFEQQIEEFITNRIDAYELDINDYKSLYKSMGEYVTDLNQYLVTVTAVISNVDWFSNIMESRNQTTGVIISNNGRELLILTDGMFLPQAESVIVTFFNDAHVPAQVKQMDTGTGLAVLAIDLTELKKIINEDKIKIAILGSSNSDNTLGTPVVAVGSPMGISNSIGYGMITATNGYYSIADRNYKIIQTDISGSQNASGALFNLQGQVIGIITVNKDSSDMKNMISAYGISDLKRIMEKMSNQKPVAYLGIRGLNISAEASAEGIPLGAFVKDVIMESPAMRAGIQKGDVIVNINDRSISTFNEYSKIVMSLEPSEKVKLTVKRKSQDEYKEMTFELEAGEVK